MSEPWLTAAIDQAQAAVGQCRSDLAAARAEQRCVAVPAGCAGGSAFGYDTYRCLCACHLAGGAS